MAGGAVFNPSLGRIGMRVLAPAVLLLAAALGVVTWRLDLDVQQQTDDTAQAYSALVSRFAEQSLTEAMLADDRPRLQRLLVQLGQEPAVDAVQIVAKDGKVVFSSEPATLGTRIDKSDPACQTCHSIPHLADAVGGNLIRLPDDSGTGRTAYRHVSPIRLSDRCTVQCHNEPVGRTVGIVIVDVDADALVGGMHQSMHRALGWTIGAALAGVIVFALSMRSLVVRRLHRLHHLLDLLRIGGRTAGGTARSRDELDELGRAVEAMATGLHDKLSVERATSRLAQAMENHPGPVLLVDGRQVVVAVNDAARQRWLGRGSHQLLSGRRRSELNPPLADDLLARAREHGMAIAQDEDGPVLVTLHGSGATILGHLEAWPRSSQERSAQASLARTSALPHRSGSVEPWMLYGAVLLSGVRAHDLHPTQRTTADWDRRVVTARGLWSRLEQASIELAAERQLVDLSHLTSVVLWTLTRDHPQAEWHTLLGQRVEVRACPYQLRLLVQDLAQAAVMHAGRRGRVVVFTEVDHQNAKARVGAWADRARAPDSTGSPRPTFGWVVAAAHGGALSQDASFDILPLVNSRAYWLPGETTLGSLWVAELPLA